MWTTPEEVAESLTRQRAAAAQRQINTAVREMLVERYQVPPAFLDQAERIWRDAAP